jgi:hypothetical protein
MAVATGGTVPFPLGRGPRNPTPKPGMIVDGDDGDPKPRILFSALLWGTVPHVFPTLVRPMEGRTPSYR